MRGDSGVAGEGRVVGVPKFYSWGKCTMPLTIASINSDWMSNGFSGLCIYIMLYYIELCYIIYLFIYVGPLSCTLGCNKCVRSLVPRPPPSFSQYLERGGW